MSQPRTVQTTLGEWVSALYEAFLEELGDAELAALATSATVQDRLSEAALDDEAVAA